MTHIPRPRASGPSLESRVLELEALFHDIDSRMAYVETGCQAHLTDADESSCSLAAPEAMRRLDILSREVRQMSAAVERLSDSLTPQAMRVERAMRTNEVAMKLSESIAKSLVRIEALLSDESETTLIEVDDDE